MKIILVFTFLYYSVTYGQIFTNQGYRLGESAEGSADYLLGNGIVDILTKDSLVLAATGFGLNKTINAGQNWTAFKSNDYQGKGGISAMTIMNDSTLWVAMAFDTIVGEGETLSAGGGLSYSKDFGATWSHLPQPIDSRDETQYEPTTTIVQNVTFDIATLDSTIWITSFGGGLRKSIDMGENWEVVTTDGKPFAAFANLNHRAFSVMVENNNVWVGTAEGISKSSDNGNTWRRFTHQNQEYPISGNFVVALAYQSFTNTIWAATIETDTTEVRAVSKSENGGETWEIMIEGTFPHNFAFDKNRIYVATDEGAFVSDDGGENWYILPPIRDTLTGEEILTSTFYSVGVSKEGTYNRFWAGSADGLASSNNNGNSWTVHRSFQSTQEPSIPNVYAYPSPFSPSRQGFIRFQYDINQAGEVIIEIYDFSMDRVATIREFESNPIGNSSDRSAKWNGVGDNGKVVASGVYFFRADIEGKINWGKLVVIN